MRFEILAKLAGEGMTMQIVVGPYPKEPPEGLVNAVKEAATERFYEWTGSHPQTVVVGCAPVGRLSDRQTG